MGKPSKYQPTPTDEQESKDSVARVHAAKGIRGKLESLREDGLKITRSNATDAEKVSALDHTLETFDVEGFCQHLING